MSASVVMHPPGGFDSRHPWRSVLRTAGFADVQNGNPAVL